MDPLDKGGVPRGGCGASAAPALSAEASLLPGLIFSSSSYHGIGRDPVQPLQHSRSSRKVERDHLVPCECQGPVPSAARVSAEPWARSSHVFPQELQTNWTGTAAPSEWGPRDLPVIFV